MKQKLLSMGLVAALISSALPTVSFAAAPTLNDITNKKQGEAVTIQGKATSSDVIIKVVDPNNLNLFFDSVKPINSGDYSSSFTLPVNAETGIYQVIAGQGTEVATDTFTVIQSEQSSGGTPSGGKPSEEEAPKVDKNGGVVFTDDVITNNNGKTQVDEKKMVDAINSAKEKIKTVEIQIKGDTSEISVPVNVLKALKDKNSEAVLEIKNEAASYKLPMKELDFKGNVSDVTIQVQKVEAPKELKDKQVKTVAPVINFTVSMTIDGKKVDIEHFNQFVSREIVTDKPFNKDRAIAVRVNKDGSLTVIPTVFNGNTAIIKSMTNSMYTIIEMDKTFNDVNNGKSWAEEYIEKLASKGIIYGKSETEYAPKTAMTRGEFAALISRSLALTPKGTGTGPFKDVTSQLAVNKKGEITAAWEAGIVQGKTKDTFNPNAKITRAEAAAMISRAMGYVTFNSSKLNTSKTIAIYKDNKNIPAWASKDVEKMLQASIMSGDPTGKFNPKNDTTRAEMAKIIVNFMEFVGMMN